MRYLGLLFINSLFTLNVFATDFCDSEWLANITRDELFELAGQGVNLGLICDDGYSVLDKIAMYNPDLDSEIQYIRRIWVYGPRDIVGTVFSEPEPMEIENCGSLRRSGHNISQTRFPVTLWLHSDIPREYIEAFYRGAQIWEDEFNRNFFDFQELPEEGSLILSWLFSHIPFLDSPIVPEKNGRSVIYWDTQWDDNDIVIARAYIENLGPRITESDIVFNAKRYRYYTDIDIANGFAEGNVDAQHLESLVAHELGHVLGFRNNDEESIMGPYRRTGDIGELDHRNMACKYDLNIFATDFCDLEWLVNITRDELLELVDQGVSL